jgi:hypothetical protein
MVFGMDLGDVLRVENVLQVPQQLRRRVMHLCYGMDMCYSCPEDLV